MMLVTISLRSLYVNLIWKELEYSTWVLYEEETGQIFGKVVGNNRPDSTYVAMVNGAILGEYLTLAHAMKACENPQVQKVIDALEEIKP